MSNAPQSGNTVGDPTARLGAPQTGIYRMHRMGIDPGHLSPILSTLSMPVHNPDPGASTLATLGSTLSNA